jgi:GTP cyclohydrolase I
MIRRDEGNSEPLLHAVSAEDCVRKILRHVGIGDQDVLDRTPARFLDALCELTAGYVEDAGKILGVQFQADVDRQTVVLGGIEFYSVCEHHLMPFFGTVDIGYHPFECVVGLSKLARVVDCYARRLQVQERMTRQIFDALTEYLSGTGVIVRVRARHFCVCGRGVQKSKAEMVTIEHSGTFNDPEQREAFFGAIR